MEGDKEIIILIAAETWNLETSEKYLQKTKEILKTLAAPKIVLIVQTDTMSGITEESIPALMEVVDVFNANNHTGLIRIDNVNSFSYKAFLEQYDKNFQENLKEGMFFSLASSIEEGLDIAHNLGYKGFEQYSK